MASYAILVGIQEYPLAGFRPLTGPLNDVELFYRWLRDPEGGNVPEGHIFKLVTVPPTVADKDCQPNLAQFNDQLEQLCFNGAGLQRRPNDRLYLYFSGHGFTDYREKIHHAALYCANARRGVPLNVCGTAYAIWAARAAAFGEIILIMDCCRNEELTKPILPPPFDDIYDADLAANVKTLEIYAAAAGFSAQERYFLDVQRQYGNLTYSLVSALYGAECMPYGAQGLVARTGYAIKQFIEGGWYDIAGANGPKEPVFVLPKKGDIALNTTPAKPFVKFVRFNPPLVSAGTLSVRRNDHDVLSAQLDPLLQIARLTSAAGGATTTQPFDGSTILLELQAGVYTLTLQQAGVADRVMVVSMIGDEDASF
jgi:hypothetical protein